MRMALSCLAYYYALTQPSDGYEGLGEVYRAIGSYFEKEKQKAAIYCQVEAIPGVRHPVLRRKTIKRTKYSLPNKGWKGRRN